MKLLRLVVLLTALVAGATLPVRLAAQANSKNPVKASLQFWDYAKELELTPVQKSEMDKIHSRYDAAREELKRINQADEPPDAKKEPRRRALEKIRAVDGDIDTLLSDEQREKWQELRGSKSSAPGTSRPTHPLLTDAEYKKLADNLRAEYSHSATNWPKPVIDEEARTNFSELGLLPSVTYPADNPFSSAKADLGKELYFDPRLSGSGQIACASCHDPDLAFADGRTVSFGHSRKELKRNAPSILNAGHLSALFWDGRAQSLEQQVRDVVNNQDEMRSGHEFIGNRLGNISAYTNEFAKVFGSPEITLARVAKAIATFERTVTTRPNDFDSFLQGDANALSDSAVRGLHLFRTAARCLNCHNGPNLTDGQFHDEGLTYYGRKLEDLGRYNVTKNPSDVGKFKTPSLRNIARTAPYMHNGLFDMDGVLNMYNAGMATVRRNSEQKDDPLFPTKDKLLQPLGLNRQEKADLKAFLESLTETRIRMRPPELPADKHSQKN